MVTLPAKYGRLAFRMAQAGLLEGRGGMAPLRDLRERGFPDGLTRLLSRQRPGVALVPFQQRAVNLFAGIAD